jgi:hypothetical protein
VLKIRLIEDGQFPFYGYHQSVRVLAEFHGKDEVHMVVMSKDKMWEKTIVRGSESLSQFKDELISGKIPSEKIRFNHDQARTIMGALPVIQILSMIVCLWMLRKILGRAFVSLFDKDKYPEMQHPKQALAIVLILSLVPGLNTLVAIFCLLIPQAVK